MCGFQNLFSGTCSSRIHLEQEEGTRRKRRAVSQEKGFLEAPAPTSDYAHPHGAVLRRVLSSYRRANEFFGGGTGFPASCFSPLSQAWKREAPPPETAPGKSLLINN